MTHETHYHFVVISDGFYGTDVVHINVKNLVMHILFVTNVGLQSSLIWYFDVVQIKPNLMWKQKFQSISLLSRY